MPQWGWIIIFATAVPLVAIITWALLKRGGSVGIGSHSIVIHGEGRSPTPLGRALKYVPDHIGQIHSLIYGRYLKLVKTKGVAHGDMTNLEDSRFARAVIRNATSLGNGSNSVQKIIEDHITSLEFIGKSLDSYVRSMVVPRVIDSVRNVINSEYDSVAHDTIVTIRKRIVSQAEFVDVLLQPEFHRDLVDALVPFFCYASECLNGRCTE